MSEDLRQAGTRVERLLDVLASADDPRVRTQAEELVKALVQIYDAGLTRMVEIIDENLDDPGRFAALLAADDLVAALLSLHGLHPVPAAQRVQAAIDAVRPGLGAHADGVELVSFGDGVVRLRIRVQGCRSTGAAVRQSVEAAIAAAVPEVSTVEVEEVSGPAGAQLIPVESLFRGRPQAVSP